MIVSSERKTIKVAVLVVGDDGYGVQLVVLNQCLLSEKYGIEFVYICICKGRLYEKLLDIGADIRLVEGRLPEPFPPNLLKSFRVFASHLKSNIGIYRKVRTLLKEISPDLVYSHRVRDHVIGGKAARFLGLKAVGHFHGILNIKRNWGLSRRIQSWLYSRYLDLGIANSQAARQSFCPPMRDKTCCIYNGLDIEGIEHQAKRFTSTASFKGADVVSVGRLVPLKEHEVLIDAVHILAQEGMEINVLLIGGPKEEGNPYYRRLKDQIEEYGLTECVRFAGFIEQPHGIVAMSKVSILCCRREGFGYSVVESMACRTAVIVPDIGGPAEYIEHDRNGLVFSAGDSKQLAEFLRRLLTNEQHRKRLVENAFAEASEKFTCDAHMTLLAKQFNRILGAI